MFIPLSPAFWCSTNMRSARLSGYNGACTINRGKSYNGMYSLGALINGGLCSSDAMQWHHIISYKGKEI